MTGNRRGVQMYKIRLKSLHESAVTSQLKECKLPASKIRYSLCWICHNSCRLQ